MTARMVLGSAQFGSDYGIANVTGKVPIDQVKEILSLARAANVRLIDTAAAYGDSECVLGACQLDGFQLVTKVPAIGPIDADRAIATIRNYARRSCANLRLPRLYGLLLHSASDLLGPSGPDIYAGLVAIRDAGLTEKIGVSVYSSDEIEAVLAKYPLNIIQLPLSILDQRLRPWLARISDCGVEAHIRSVFLQGILLRPADALPLRLAPLAPAIEAFRIRAVAQGLNVLEASLAFVRDLPGVNCIVVGTTKVDEFQSVIEAFGKRSRFDADGLAVEEFELTDPRRWKVA